MFSLFQELLTKNKIQIRNTFLNDLAHSFSFYFFTKIDDNISSIPVNDNNSKIIIIDEYVDSFARYKIGFDFFIVCFDKVLIIFDQSQKNKLIQFLSDYKKSTFYCLSDDTFKFIKKKLNPNDFHIYSFQQKEAEIFNEEISSLSKVFSSIVIEDNSKNLNKIKILWKIISRSFCGFLIKKSYNNTKFDRIFIQNKFEEIELLENQYVKLRRLGKGNSSVFLIIVIEMEQIFALKIFNDPDEGEKLFKRERENYLNLHHLFFPRYFGITTDKSYKCIIIEYCSGNSLENIDKMNFQFMEKIQIIVDIMLSLEYLQFKGYVYRDLKPNNIIIDEEGKFSLIDFDRVIKSSIVPTTRDFTHYFCAPEVVVDGKPITSKADVYSLGKMINFIFSGEIPKDPLIQLIYHLCVENDEQNRPSVDQLLFLILSYNNPDFLKDPKSLFTLFILAARANNPESQTFIGYTFINNNYITQGMEYLTLAVNQNHPEAQAILGKIYCDGIYVQRDINKSIYYLTLASDNNHIGAQYSLGKIYYEGIYLKRNIQKSIHFLTLASNQNNQESQLLLCKIYFEGIDIAIDIKKAIFFLEKAAKQNNSIAQRLLGEIYYYGQNISPDIEKAIHYFTLASNQKEKYAQYYLGLIYFNDIHVPKDIAKAIYYFELSANQNHALSQLYLGKIYYDKIYGKQDFNKAIHYFTLASDQNEPISQAYLGEIYLYGFHIQKDFDKANYYFTLSAHQNNVNALYYLGWMHYKGIKFQKNINEAIYYLKKASDLNDAMSQNLLAQIYINKNDMPQAFKYLNLAANQNDPEAQYYLGFYNYIGFYVPRDIRKSIYFFTLSSNQNYSDSQYMLGKIYYENIYIPRDMEKSLYYLNLSFNQNNAMAQYLLGGILYEGKFVQRDINKSIHYFKLSANQNYFVALYQLGGIYYEDKYVKRDIYKSIRYFKLAANQNFHPAQCHLGFIYYQGKYIKRDINQSILYFKLAANQNNVEALYSLGEIYYMGLYVKQDIQKSIHYLKESSCFNCSHAKNILGIIYKNGEGVQKNIAKSIEYFNEAIKQKEDTFAMYNLSRIYYFGIDTYKQIPKSIELLEKASKNGCYLAYLFLFFIFYESNNKQMMNFYKSEISKIIKTDFLSIIQERLKKRSNQKNLFSERLNIFFNQYDLINCQANIQDSYADFTFYMLFGVFFKPKSWNMVNTKLKDINEEFYHGFYDD